MTLALALALQDRTLWALLALACYALAIEPFCDALACYAAMVISCCSVAQRGAGSLETM